MRGTGCTQRFIEAGLKVQGVNILSGREEIARVEMTDIESPYNFVLMIPQSDTERLLEEHTPRFALFAEDTPGSRSLLSKYPNLVEASPRKQYADGGIWVVRPDGYVALAAKHDA